MTCPCHRQSLAGPPARIVRRRRHRKLPALGIVEDIIPEAMVADMQKQVIDQSMASLEEQAAIPLSKLILAGFASRLAVALFFAAFFPKRDPLNPRKVTA